MRDFCFEDLKNESKPIVLLLCIIGFFDHFTGIFLCLPCMQHCADGGSLQTL
jgi:hypothetical protein